MPYDLCHSVHKHINPQQRRWVATSPGPPQKNTNNLILLGVGAAASVGAYYYLRNTPPEDLSGRAKRDEETMAQKARESLEAGKARSDIARKEALQKYEHAKAGISQWSRSFVIIFICRKLGKHMWSKRCETHNHRRRS